MRKGSGLAIAAAVMAFAAAGPASAETITFQAPMSGAKEAPPNNSPGTGLANMTFDTQTRLLSWDISYKDLTGPAIGAHIHGLASDQVNAGVLVPFKTTESPIKGSVTLTEAQAKGLMSGKLYVNIHTAEHPGGELRGQLAKPME